MPPIDVLREAMGAEEPALALNAIGGRVPLDSVVNVGDGAQNERDEAVPNAAFPFRQNSEITPAATTCGNTLCKDLCNTASKTLDKLPSIWYKCTVGQSSCRP